MRPGNELVGERPLGSAAPLLLTHALFCLAYAGVTFNASALGLVVRSSIYPLSLVLVLLCAWCLWSWRELSGVWFTPYAIFFLSGAVFNGGHALLEVFHLNRNGILDGEFSSTTVVRTLLLVTLGLACFHLGAMISAVVANHRAQRSNWEPRIWSDFGAIRLVGWSLFAVAVVPALMDARQQLSVVASLGYDGLYRQNAATGTAAGPALLAEFLVPSAIFILLGSRGRRVDIWFSAAVVGAHALLDLYLGYRAYAIWPVLAYVWAFHRSVRPVPRSVIFGGAAFLFFFAFPTIAAIRNEAGNERDSLAASVRSFQSIDNPGIATIAEMGSSMQTVAHTIELVPVTHPFEHGAGYLYALTTALPNVFGGSVHPAIAHGTGSDWLIWTVNPYIAARGGGLGYSFIAEAFLNFGWLGTPVTLMVIGAGFGAFFCWTTRWNDPLKIALAAVSLSFLSHYARGELISVVRSLAWNALLPYALVLIASAALNARDELRPGAGTRRQSPNGRRSPIRRRLSRAALTARTSEWEQSGVRPVGR